MLNVYLRRRTIKKAGVEHIDLRQEKILIEPGVIKKNTRKKQQVWQVVSQA